jgi:transcriptional regulator PpsR
MRPFVAPETLLGDLGAAAAAALLSASGDIVLILDAQGAIRDVACGESDVAGQDWSLWIGRRWVETVTVESRGKVESLIADASVPGAAPRWRQLNQVLPGGREMPVLFMLLPLPPAATGTASTIAIGRDLRPTAALQQRLLEAQQAMERDYWKFRHAETRYRHLFQVSSEAVLVLDAGTQKILEANPAAVQLLGAADSQALLGQGFPLGLEARSAGAVNNLLAGVRATGRPDQVRAELLDAAGELTVAVSTYRQERVSHFLVRLNRTQAGPAADQAPSVAELLLQLVGQAPDGLLVTDLDGRVLSANSAFIELAQLTSEDQVRGETLDRWLGRTGVDLSVMISNLRQRGSVRLFATTLRGEYGSVTEVEISATQVSHGGQAFLGFAIRDVARRLAHDPRARRELPRSVGQLTELVGRVPLKDIVGETTDLIEQLCIEAALELTRDNRASAAEMLGLSRQSLYVKLRRYGLGDLGSPGGEAPEK